jgi:alanine racemase
VSIRFRTDKLLSSFAKSFTVYNEIKLYSTALLNNVSVLSKLSPENNIIPVLKSNAYGHGLSEIAKMLSVRKFPYIAVDGYFEAIAIHEVSKQPVLVMGAIAPDNFSKIKPKNCAFVVHDRQTIEAMGKSRKKFTLHLEIETGMSRHGVDPTQVLDYVNQIKSYSNLNLEGVMSHLADADNPDDAFTENQTIIFDNCVEQIINSGLRLKWVHIAQSAGLPKVKSKYANATRTGIALYGINPLEKKDKNFEKYSDLEPVLELVSTVTKIQKISYGTSVGYGCTFVAEKDTVIAVLPLGYYEGIPRELSNKGHVEINGKSHKIAGRVCMNITMIDASVSEVKIGDKAVIISNDKNSRISAESVCKINNLFIYSYLTSLNQNIRRRIV